MTRSGTSATISVIVPAHDEAAVIGRLLDLLDTDGGEHLEVLVVCNGCQDGTERVAREHASSPTVLSIPEASKHLALQAGDLAANHVPRFYVDADIEIDATALLTLAEALKAEEVHAVAPERGLDLTRSSRLVRSYYRVWQQLPTVQEGLFGRGVMGVDVEGLERIRDRPDVLGDDLYFHRRFDPGERVVVTRAVSVIRAPRTLRDLVRRRVRAINGNAQLAEMEVVPAPGSPAETGIRALVTIALRQPRRGPDIAIFLAVTLLARTSAAAAADKTVWHRDDSSRLTD